LLIDGQKTNSTRTSGENYVIHASNLTNRPTGMVGYEMSSVCRLSVTHALWLNRTWGRRWYRWI